MPLRIMISYKNKTLYFLLIFIIYVNLTHIDFSKLEIKETNDERLERLEEQRQVAMDKCRYIADSARNNRTTNATRNIGTLTMIFGGATSVGLLLLKEPTLSNYFGALVIVGAAIYANRRLHKNTTKKMNMHKQMVKLVDERHDELAIMNIKTTITDNIPMPKYEEYQKQARKYVDDNEKTILAKTNFKIMQRAMTAFAGAALVSVTLNLVEKNELVDYKKIWSNIRETFVSDKDNTCEHQRKNRPC